MLPVWPQWQTVKPKLRWKEPHFENVSFFDIGHEMTWQRVFVESHTFSLSPIRAVRGIMHFIEKAGAGVGDVLSSMSRVNTEINMFEMQITQSRLCAGSELWTLADSQSLFSQKTVTVYLCSGLSPPVEQGRKISQWNTARYWEYEAPEDFNFRFNFGACLWP